jgi:hypothetical protein
MLAAGSVAAQTTIDWTTQANPHRGADGTRLTLVCPSGGVLSDRIWGTDLYTDDSSVCTAAVHAGRITTARGGTVTIEIRPGAAAYKGSTRNGATSNDYGQWSGSFSFVDLPVEAAPVAGSAVIPADWTTQADPHRGRNGARVTLSCPAGGAISSRLWGTDLYTDDSSICTAAVHAGRITTTRGGTVTIEIRPGAAAYKGSTRNGATSNDYGQWSGSFAFVATP